MESMPIPAYMGQWQDISNFETVQLEGIKPYYVWVEDVITTAWLFGAEIDTHHCQHN